MKSSRKCRSLNLGSGRLGIALTLASTLVSAGCAGKATLRSTSADGGGSGPADDETGVTAGSPSPGGGGGGVAGAGAGPGAGDELGRGGAAGLAGASSGAGDAGSGAGGTGGGVAVPDGASLVGDLSSEALPIGTPVIDPDNGYASLSTGTVVMSGFVSSYEGGSGSTISLTCTASSFCASGTVGASSTYSSWAGAGFSVNQAKSGASGTTGTLALVGSDLTVSYSNPGASQLELQLYAADGASFWCYYLPASTTATSKTIPLASMNTACWDEETGQAFASGTAITSVQLMVPGAASTPTPFNFCFLGLTVQ